MSNAFDQFDEEAAPVEEGNPFDQFDAETPAPVTASGNNPFDQFDEKPKAESGLGTLARKAAHDAPVLIGSLPAMGYGAAQGAALGAPFAPVGPIVGGIAGGLAAGLGAGYVLDHVSDYIKSKIGLDDSEQRAVNAQENPWWDVGGSAVSTLAGFNVGKGLMLGTRAVNAAAMGGLEAGQELYQKGEIDPSRVLAQAVVGGVLANPNKLGAAGLGLGERFAKPIPGRPNTPPEVVEPEQANVDTPIQPQTAPGVAVEQPAPTKGADVGHGPDTGSETNYGKTPETGGGLTEVRRGSVFDDPAVLSAFETKLEAEAVNRPRNDPAAEVPYDGTKPEVNTGLIEANNARIAELEAQLKAAKTVEEAQQIAVAHADKTITEVVRDRPELHDKAAGVEQEVKTKVAEEAAEIWQKAHPPEAEVTAPVTEPPVVQPTRRQQIEAGRPAEAEAVQNRQGVINKAAAALRLAGKNQEVERLFTLPAEKQADAFAQLHNTVLGRAGEVSTSKRLRNPEVTKALEIDGLGVTAGTKEKAQKYTRSIEALENTFTKHTPVEGETKDALKARLLKGISEADAANGGESAVKTYKPRVPPRGWMWAEAAQKLLKSRMTDAQVQKFIADEKLMRGSPEDVEAYRQSRRGEADIAMSRRSGDEALAVAEKKQPFPGDVDAPEGVGVKREIKNSDDLARPEVLKEHLEETRKVEETLQKLSDSGELSQTAKFETTEGEKKAAQNRARTAGESTLIPRAQKETATGDALKAITERKAQTIEKQKENEAALYGAGRERQQAVRKGENFTAGKDHADTVAVTVRKKGVREKLGPIDDPARPQSFIDDVRKSLQHFKKDESGGIDLGVLKDKIARTADAVYPTSFLRKAFGVRTSEIMRVFDNVMGEMVTAVDKLAAERTAMTKARWYTWMKGTTQDEVFTFLNALERTTALDKTTGKLDRAAFRTELEDAGISANQLDWMSREAEFMRKVLDAAYAFEKQHGSKAEWRENYFPHLFEKPELAEKFINEYAAKHGATWYQKERAFDFLDQARKAGLKLKYDNPIDMLNARLRAGAHSSMMVASLRKLHEQGLAFPSKNAPDFIRTNKWVELPPTPDRQTWYIHPEGRDLMANAFDPKSFWGEGIPKDIRGVWMQIKNVWMPIQLSLSAFHELHVIANINPTQNLVRALRLAYHDPKSAPSELGKALWWSLKDPVLSLPLDKIGLGIGKFIDEISGKAFSQSEGRRMMNLSDTPKSQMSQIDRVWSYLQEKGSWSPHQSAEDVINAEKAFVKARHDKSWKMLPTGLRRGVEVSQAAMFKYQIPAMKNLAWKRDVAAALKIEPSLMHDEGRLQSTLREISKNIDDRYGEMFYKTLFINKTLKDTGIMSMLSMSWNLGQVRQLAGAVTAPVKQLAVGTGMKQIGPREAAAMKLDDKLPFVGMYIGMSMMSGGLLTYALTGKAPTDIMDYLYPRTGLTNPDGRDGRLSPPFNTREYHMLKGHAEEHGGGLTGWLKGGLALLWNKMILSPLTDAFTNKDFYGRNLYDTSAPWYKQALQAVDATLGKNLNPISFSGADRAVEVGGGPREKALAYAGFGPAPKYIENTAMENKIAHAAREYHNPYARPYEYGEKTGLGRGLVQGGIRKATDDPLKSEIRREARTKAQLAEQRGDMDEMAKWKQVQVEKGGQAARTVARQRPGEEAQYQFSQIPIEKQTSLVTEMTKAERVQFVMENRLLGPGKRRDLIKLVPTLNEQ